MKQRKPFQAVLTDKMKRGLIELKQRDGIDRGFFFDSSGNFRSERLNPTAQYHYHWTTREAIDSSLPPYDGQLGSVPRFLAS